MSAITTRLRRAPAAGTLGRAWSWWTDAGRARPANYVLLVATIAVLNIIGLVFVLSASSVMSLDDYGSAWFFFQRQLLWVALGAVGFMVTSRIDYRAWRRLTIPLVLATGALLVIVLIPGIGIWVDGSRRWLGSGQLRFQPSEIAKLALLVYAADLLTRREAELYDWRRVLGPVLAVFGFFALLVLKEPDLDSTMVLAVVVGAVLILGGIRAKHLAALGASTVLATTVLAYAAPYRRQRMLTFLHPWKDASNTGYQIVQSLIALGSGGWTGVGLGAGRAKWRFLPAAHTDFIFAIIGEETGLLGCLLVVSLFLGFAFLGARAALRAPDRFGMLMAGGVTCWVVGQAVINIGMVVGLLPVSGLTLPFVSFGGTSLVFTMFATGILANVARQGRPASVPARSR